MLFRVLLEHVDHSVLRQMIDMRVHQYRNMGTDILIHTPKWDASRDIWTASGIRAEVPTTQGERTNATTG